MVQDQAMAAVMGPNGVDVVEKNPDHLAPFLVEEAQNHDHQILGAVTNPIGVGQVKDADIVVQAALGFQVHDGCGNQVIDRGKDEGLVLHRL